MLRLGVIFFYFLGLVILTFRGWFSYVWGLDFLHLVVSNSYVQGLVLLRLGVSYSLLTFESYFIYVRGLLIVTFGD